MPGILAVLLGWITVVALRKVASLHIVMNRTDCEYQTANVRVGLVLQTGQALMRGIIRGVYRFLRVSRHWRIHGEGQHPLLDWSQVADWEGDGLITDWVFAGQRTLTRLIRAAGASVDTHYSSYHWVFSAAR